MVYDGFDRLHQLRYPDPMTGAPSATDYEEHGYDPAGNVVTTRTRAGQTFTAAHDALNRMTALTAPAGTGGTTYAYDNLGRLISASAPASGVVNAWAWDALSRLTADFVEKGVRRQLA